MVVKDLLNFSLMKTAASILGATALVLTPLHGEAQENIRFSTFNLREKIEQQVNETIVRRLIPEANLNRTAIDLPLTNKEIISFGRIKEKKDQNNHIGDFPTFTYIGVKYKVEVNF